MSRYEIRDIWRLIMFVILAVCRLVKAVCLSVKAVCLSDCQSVSQSVSLVFAEYSTHLRCYTCIQQYPYPTPMTNVRIMSTEQSRYIHRSIHPSLRSSTYDECVVRIAARFSELGYGWKHDKWIASNRD